MDIVHKGLFHGSRNQSCNLVIYPFGDMLFQLDISTDLKRTFCDVYRTSWVSLDPVATQDHAFSWIFGVFSVASQVAIVATWLVDGSISMCYECCTLRQKAHSNSLTRESVEKAAPKRAGPSRHFEGLDWPYIEYVFAAVEHLDSRKSVRKNEYTIRKAMVVAMRIETI